MAERRLRPWVWHTIEAVEGLIMALIIIACFCYVIEAMTGFNPIWLLGAM